MPDSSSAFPTVILHPPITTATVSSATTVPNHQPPPAPSWLYGKWHVTHSTLPMWRSKRNVSITYKPNSTPTHIDDLVDYQSLHNDKLQSVHGVDKPVADASGWAWDWRGKGWLMIASSRWEVLGYGNEDNIETGSVEPQEQASDRRQWVVTYFAKTLFTPAGIDLYSRHPDGLKPRTVDAIKNALAAVEDEGVRKLGTALFEVKMD